MWRERALRAEQAQHDAIKAAPDVVPAQNVDAAVARGQQREAAQTVQQIEQEIWAPRVENVRSSHPDFEQIAYNKAVPYSDAMVAIVRGAENGPDIAYHLGQNQSEAIRISQLSPMQAAVSTTPATRTATHEPGWLKRQVNRAAMGTGRNSERNFWPDWRAASGRSDWPSKPAAGQRFRPKSHPIRSRAAWLIAMPENKTLAQAAMAR
jgi:hypothetical protein